MAVTWEVTITPTNLAEKRASVSAIRTDDILLTSLSFSITTIIDTTEQKVAAMDAIWQQYQDKISLDAQIAAVIGTLESQAKANLEARE